MVYLLRTILALTLFAPAPTYHSEASHRHAPERNLCPGWYAQILPDAGIDNMDWTMHALGCAAPYGLWQPGTTRCARIAYHVSGIRFDYAAVGRRGCVLMEDGSWANE